MERESPITQLSRSSFRGSLSFLCVLDVVEKLGLRRSCPTLLWTCGDGRYGQLGLPSSQLAELGGSGALRPTIVPFLRSIPLRAVFAGGRSSFAIAATDELYFWGHKYDRAVFGCVHLWRTE